MSNAITQCYFCAHTKGMPTRRRRVHISGVDAARRYYMEKCNVAVRHRIANTHTHTNIMALCRAKHPPDVLLPHFVYVCETSSRPRVLNVPLRVHTHNNVTYPPSRSALSVACPTGSASIYHRRSIVRKQLKVSDDRSVCPPRRRHTTLSIALDKLDEYRKRITQ